MLDLIQVIQVVLSLGIAAGATWVLLRHRGKWSAPASELARLVRAVREGRVPIEEVRRAATGGVAPLGHLLADLLHEVRSGEVERAKLEAEMSQRVANRTDALERSMTSLKNQAHRDPLTGLYNRRALEVAFPKVIEQCRSAGTDLVVMMIDLDRFKLVNDTLGHLVGDKLIADVGKLVRSAIRETDFAFRYGGDEFVVLLPGARREGARALADRLVKMGGELGKTLKVRPAPGLSVGMTSMSEHAARSSGEELLKWADEALYSIKAARKCA